MASLSWQTLEVVHPVLVFWQIWIVSWWICVCLDQVLEFGVQSLDQRSRRKALQGELVDGNFSTSDETPAGRENKKMMLHSETKVIVRQNVGKSSHAYGTTKMVYTIKSNSHWSTTSSNFYAELSVDTEERPGHSWPTKVHDTAHTLVHQKVLSPIWK